MVKNRLLHIRLSRGFKKQKDFAEFLGVTRANYNKWENNNSQPPLEEVLKMAKKLELNIEDIIYLEGE